MRRLPSPASRSSSRVLVPLAFAALALVAGGCRVGGAPPGPGRDGGTSECPSDGLYCAGPVLYTCAGGVRSDVGPCAAGEACVEGLGCSACRPGTASCDGANILRCRADGSGYDVESTCPDRQICYASGPSAGCWDACAVAEMNRSNLGCEYWAVDLDNEYADLRPLFPIVNDAAGQQFAVVIANPSDHAATVYVEVNDALPGETVSVREVFRDVVAPRATLQIDLPAREVDGSTDTGHNDGPGTWLSSRAYHVVADYPIVAYQFNPIVQQYSNDASLLLSAEALDNEYRVLGWPTANPISFLGSPIDHSYVTIIGTTPGTTVSVTLGGPIIGGGPVPATDTGGVVTATLGPFDVLNLESTRVPGDLSGTIVRSSAPVAVFSGGERGIAPYGTDGLPVPPGVDPTTIDVCCTDHLEEQVFPTAAWGSRFVIGHSPVRCDAGCGGWVEPDIYRVMADRDTTTVTTNASGTEESFVLAPGEWREFYSQRSFVLTADHPISIEQILVSQQFLPSWRPGAGGDPTMTLMPPVEQFRERYVFLTPTTFTEDYIVLAMPDGSSVIIDGLDLTSIELQTVCTFTDAGIIDGQDYDIATCTVDDGPHEVESNAPVGLIVYGYYNVGSYGYAAGTDLERIYLF